MLEDNGDDTYKIVFDDGEVRKRFKSIYLRAVSTNAKTVSHKGSKIDASEPNSESSLDASLLDHDKTKKANVKTASHKASKADANEHNSESSFDASLVDDIYTKKLMKDTASLVQDGIISKAQAKAFLQQEMAKLYAVHGKASKNRLVVPHNSLAMRGMDSVIIFAYIAGHITYDTYHNVT